MIFVTLFHGKEFDEGDLFFKTTTVTFNDYIDTFLLVYTMLLGEVMDAKFSHYPEALIFFVIFMVLMVVLLANVLIAIVTDAYSVIKNERAEIVFWSNRLDYVHEMNAASKLFTNGLKRCFGGGSDKEIADDKQSDGLRELWNDLLMTYSESNLDVPVCSSEFWSRLFIRFAILVGLFIWVLLGICSLTILWPPQIRNFMIGGRISRSDDNNTKRIEQQRSKLTNANNYVKDWQKEISEGRNDSRNELELVRKQIEDFKKYVSHEMDEIRDNISVLLDMLDPAT